MDVVVNPPAVTSLECAVGLPMAGFAIVAQAEAEFEAELSWEWLREELEEVEQNESSGEPAAAAAAAVAVAVGEGATKKGQKKKIGPTSGSRGRWIGCCGGVCGVRRPAGCGDLPPAPQRGSLAI